MTTEQKEVLLQLLTAGTQAMGLGAFEEKNAVTISGAIQAFRDLSPTDKTDEPDKEVVEENTDP